MSEERIRYAGMWPSQSEAIAQEAVERLESEKRITKLEAEVAELREQLDLQVRPEALREMKDEAVRLRNRLNDTIMLVKDSKRSVRLAYEPHGEAMDAIDDYVLDEILKALTEKE